MVVWSRASAEADGGVDGAMSAVDAVVGVDERGESG
jgi:hypothetical protein